MRYIWQVIKHDVAVTIRQRSFWILTLLGPVLMLGINGYARIQEGSDADTGYDPGRLEGGRSTAEQLPRVGLVDEAGLITALPPEFPADLFLDFPDTVSAMDALDAGVIEQYVVIPADYLVSGQVTVFDRNFQIRSSGEDMGVAFGSDNAWLLRNLIDFNLTGDEGVVNALRNPVPAASARPHQLIPPDETEANDRAMAEIVASVMPYVFYFLLLMSSSYLMRSVVSEKENRTAELLLLSLDPRQLMVGKILAMSVALLVQLVAWVGGGFLILNKGAELLKVAEFAFPPGFFLWAGLYLVLGYLVFAGAMVTAGALAPNAREAGQMTWVLIIPLMPTLMFADMFVNQPENPLTLFLSLFPFSAPSAMVTRLAVSVVPLWQILISLAGLALTAYLFIILAGRFFRPGNLLSEARFSWRRLMTDWRT